MTMYMAGVGFNRAQTQQPRQGDTGRVWQRRTAVAFTTGKVCLMGTARWMSEEDETHETTTNAGCVHR
jgi:hypothetical protein